MNNKQMALARKQLERRLVPLRQMTLVPPPLGWIRAIRQSLGMTNRQLATRMGVGTSRIAAIERAEITGATTLRTLRQAATAMNCRLIYAFVPVEPLDDILSDRAIDKARKSLSRLDHTMLLENQAVRPADLDAERKRAVDLILAGSLRGLWDDEERGARSVI